MSIKCGWLSVAPEFLAERLGLPDDAKIIGAHFGSFAVKFAVESEGLPESPDETRGQSLPDVTMLVHQTDDPKTGLRKLEGSWSHAPEKCWLIDERPIPPVDLEFANLLFNKPQQSPPSDHQS